MNASDPYCQSRFTTIRRSSRPVKIGNLTIGGQAPIAVQSMTTTPTLDVEATVRQCIALAEVNCDIIRITAQNVAAAKALEAIRAQFSAAGFSTTPLVADIHFLPSAAMEAVKWVEKVRINPGNYADKKKFQLREYSDSQYNEELERLHEAFSPIVLRCKELGRAMRIGTNHGSLSDRIMNRYGDTPLGMCESALEFLRIAESHGFHDIVLSMKASNPKIMIQAYRMIVAKMSAENMFYPLHLGVTEAGDGDDARIKSAIGIGSLLYDGLGDTIRVSLTEDPVYEVPVARQLVEKATALWQPEAGRTLPDPINPYHFEKRGIYHSPIDQALRFGPLEPPRVVGTLPFQEDETLSTLSERLKQFQAKQKDARLEILQLPSRLLSSLNTPATVHTALRKNVDALLWDFTEQPEGITAFDWKDCPGDILLITFDQTHRDQLTALFTLATENKLYLALDLLPDQLAARIGEFKAAPAEQLIFTSSHFTQTDPNTHPLGRYRQLAEVLQSIASQAPIWIRATHSNQIQPAVGFGDQLIESSILTGAAFCDGFGDFISIETVEDPSRATNLAYNILQGVRARSIKTEYVACPSCGRTLFDLQTTTQRIRTATGHLKGVTIAVMGCIVNGPGEMADADFGYVGGAPGKVNLYVGKECVQYHIPADQAVDALIDLIKSHHKWEEPVLEATSS